MSDKVRLDKWLWAARFFKTRAIAAKAIAAGHIKIDGDRLKASFAIKPGMFLQIQKGPYQHVVEVLDLSEKRGPASVAQKLYQETQDSIARRADLALQFKIQAQSQPEQKGRPSKRDRRDLLKFKGRSQ